MIYILILYGIVSLISYLATAAILGKFEKGGGKMKARVLTSEKDVKKAARQEYEEVREEIFKECADCR